MGAGASALGIAAAVASAKEDELFEITKALTAEHRAKVVKALTPRSNGTTGGYVAGEKLSASGKKDPGCIDKFGNFWEKAQETGTQEMNNIELTPNNAETPNDGEQKQIFPDHPVVKELMKITPAWKLEDQKRNFALIVLDMEIEYDIYLDYILPNAQKLIAKFRELSLPIVWTNWARKVGDGWYGAIDRYYGPKGMFPPNEANAVYCYKEKGEDALPALAPQTPDEMSLVIQSFHLNKFADLDENGREILYPMLEAWGVDTLIVMGAWTDDCIAATAFDAIDRYGYDVVLVNDAMATGTINGNMMMKCLSASSGNAMPADDIVAYLSGHPDLIDSPKAPLNGSVQKFAAPKVITRGQPGLEPSYVAGEKISASGKKDPGCIDKFGNFWEKAQETGTQEMNNIELTPNNAETPNDGEQKQIFPDHPVVKELMKITPAWKLGDQKRNFALIVLDMEIEYDIYLDYIVPNAQKMIAKFRELSLPIVWTNWARKVGDGWYGAIDRYYGPKGMFPPNEANAVYCYKEKGEDALPALAPQTPDEMSLVVQSFHLDKFADLDENGREILYPMLEAWGVDTLIVMGAWTDDCIMATGFSAIDRYGYDVVLVNDAMATGTINGNMMMKCLSASVGNAMPADDIVAYLSGHPDLIEAPKAPLNASVKAFDAPLVGIRH